MPKKADIAITIIIRNVKDLSKRPGFI